MVDIRNLIAAISPEVYCDSSVRKKVKEIAKKEGYLKAASEAKLVEASALFEDDFTRVSSLKAPKPLEAPGLKFPLEARRIIYDSPSESLEPLYYWILDFMNNASKRVDKLVDNFVSAPGSAHFSELGMKATKMQEEAMKTLGAVNQVLKSILNIIYDLKEFKLRLDVYDKYKNSEGSEKEAAFLSLKQIWLDNVDIKRGNTAIKAMAQQFDYVTIIDGFMVVKNPDELTKKPEDGGLDLNDRVRRILQQRLVEFLTWIKESELELRKRFEIEKRYLKSQVSTIKLYARWVKPYLESARKLEQRANPSASLVTAFNTLLLELSILGQNEYKPDDDVATGDLPELFKRIKARKYYSLVMVEFKFRGIPQRAGQGFTFGGRTEINFLGFSLNEQELKALKSEIEKDEFGDVLSLIDSASTESLAQLQSDIDYFLEDKKPEEKAKLDEEDTNPFSALFNFFKSEKKEDKKDKDSKEIKQDDMYERILRSQSIVSARDLCTTLFETYKKAHGMPSF